MTAGHFKRTRSCPIVVALLIALISLASAQVQPETAPAPMDRGIIQGRVLDLSGRPVANASVSLEIPEGAQRRPKPVMTSQTDANGAYRFSNLHRGTYMLVAELAGHGGSSFGSIVLSQDEVRTVDLELGKPKSLGTENSPPSTDSKVARATEAPAFYDEPEFTVAGVTQATNSGGHGSDTVSRTTEALAKATVSLSEQSENKTNGNAGVDAGTQAGTATAQSLRDQIAREPENAAAHHSLGEIEEKLGHPLEAVREYQRAADIQPSEANLFDWGTELLTHRALEPATEVYARGNSLYPKSVRMLIGLGVAWYARGSSERAAHFLSSASDLDPQNPTPYSFLGRMQNAEIVTPEDAAQRLKRFVELYPNNAMANYYYAVCLWKQSATKEVSDSDHPPAQQGDSSLEVETLLHNAVRLDPNLGPAYLQLGILYSQRGDFRRAIPEYQKAIALSPEFDPSLAQTHYRLAQAYLRTGDKAGGKAELELQQRATEQTKADTQREHREIQEFVITLGKHNSEPPEKP